jgi:hypothetical protein
LLLLLVAPGLQFQVTDGRGKDTPAVTLEAAAPDADGWRAVRVGKARGDAVLVWPFDGLAKAPDGPEPIPAIVIRRGEEKALANKRVVAAIATPVVLGTSTIEETAGRTGFTVGALAKAFADLPAGEDPFEKGVGLLHAGKYGDGAASLAVALKQRQRQLTRIPSEIYPAAMLDGLALFRAGKFDNSAVAYLTALEQRPSDQAARKLRAEALTRVGKADAAGR